MGIILILHFADKKTKSWLKNYRVSSNICDLSEMNDVSQTEFDTLQPTHLTHCNQLLCSEKYILDQSAEVLLSPWYTVHSPEIKLHI